VEREPDYLEQLETFPDVILADFAMPNFGARPALRLLRERQLEIPFIVVSGSIGEDTAVEMMKQGAADYLLKDRLGRLGAAVSRALQEKRLVEEKRLAEKALRDAELRLRESQKMEALGQLAGGVAHDFNNLLGVIIGYSELLSSELPPDPVTSRRIGAIKKSAERAASLTTQLLAFSRRQMLQPRVLNLNSLVTDTDAILQRLIGADVEARSVLDLELGNINADPGQIVQVIINLAVNARDAMPEGGKLKIETKNVDLDAGETRHGIPIQPGRYTMLAVSDTGIGMDAATRAHIFEPFFTTKPVGKGSGLGLATVYGIVKQSAGHIVVDTEVGKGTTFRIYLPQVDEDVKGALLQPAAAQTGPASETIMLVEDEEPMRALLLEDLQASGYRVLAAGNGVEALQIAAQYRGSIDLLITDVIMPQISGPALARTLTEHRPNIKVIYISGYSDEKVRDIAMADPHVALVQKPFQLKELNQKLRDVLNRRDRLRPVSVETRSPRSDVSRAEG
jgi:signal transduction histidine kinase